jgi:hypothetical protein
LESAPKELVRNAGLEQCRATWQALAGAAVAAVAFTVDYTELIGKCTSPWGNKKVSPGQLQAFYEHDVAELMKT